MNKKILKIMLFALSFLLVITNLAATSVEVVGKSAEIKNQEFENQVIVGLYIVISHKWCLEILIKQV